MLALPSRAGPTYAAKVQIDLNADVGEGMPHDTALMALVSSANIATGAHAGGGSVLVAAVADAVAQGVAVGAHPSYRDRAGFGRLSLLEQVRSDPGGQATLVADLVVQVLEVAREAGGTATRITHVKAHGALYNEAVAEPLVAEIMVESVLRVSEHLGYAVAVMTQPMGALAAAADHAGLAVVSEGFIDRAYQPDGTLVPRSRPGAVLDSVPRMVEQALALAHGSLRAADGTLLAMPVDSLCVHGDTPLAVAAARHVRSELASAGWRIVAPARDQERRP